MNEDIDMSDETEIETEDSPNFARLRKQLSAVEAERDAYKTRYETARSRLVTNAAELAGYTAKDDGTFDGVAGLLVKEFQGSLGEDDVPTRAGFLSLAEQYGVLPQTAAPRPAEPSLADQLRELQAPGDALRQVAQAVQPAGDLRDDIRKAEADGDWARAAVLKDQQVQQMHA